MTHDADDLDQYAELAALADGTLAVRRRVELEHDVSASPTLQAVLAEQQQAVAERRGGRAAIYRCAGWHGLIHSCSAKDRHLRAAGHQPCSHRGRAVRYPRRSVTMTAGSPSRLLSSTRQRRT